METTTTTIKTKEIENLESETLKDDDMVKVDDEVSLNMKKKNVPADFNLAETVMRLVQQNDELLHIVTKIQEDNVKNNSRITDIYQKLGVLNTDVQGIIKSQEFINKEFNDQKDKHNKLDKRVEKLEKTILQHKTDIKNLEKLVSDLQTTSNAAKSAVNDLEQYGRREMVDICGIPRSADEDTDKIVLDIAAKINVEMVKTDIAISHRTKPTPDSPIIVKFVSRRVCDDFFQKRTQLKNKTIACIGYNGNNKIYVNESLTSYNGELLKKARKSLKADNKFKHVWTKHGSVFARKSDNSEKKLIRSVKDITNLLGNNDE